MHFKEVSLAHTPPRCAHAARPLVLSLGGRVGAGGPRQTPAYSCCRLGLSFPRPDRLPVPGPASPLRPTHRPRGLALTSHWRRQGLRRRRASQAGAGAGWGRSHTPSPLPGHKDRNTCATLTCPARAAAPLRKASVTPRPRTTTTSHHFLSPGHAAVPPGAGG